MTAVRLSPENNIYEVELLNRPSDKIVELLKSTKWGTNGTIYQHQNTEQDIHKMLNPVYFSLQKEGQLIGTCSFSKRQTEASGNKTNSYFSRYFSIQEKKQGGIFGKMILKYIKTYFEQNTENPTAFYAYVDETNIRSYKLLRHIGFENIRSFETLAFSRLFPKTDARVQLISKEDQKKLFPLLKEQYQNYSFVHLENIFAEENYYVLKSGDEIVAGIRVHVGKWIIRQLPGFSGKFIVHCVPSIPIASRLFNAKDFRFLAFDGIYCKYGFEKELFVLMESICAKTRIYTGMTWLDNNSELYSRLQSGDWGIMNKLKDDIPVCVVSGFKNISEEEIKGFKNRPVFISALDIV